jgi:ATP-dependent Clp protease ATP-binding subunit ClpA
MYGAPPGYVGYEEGGQLTEPVRKKPYQVVNFDEIEKAHPDAANVLLSIMEEGTLTDGRGRTADFRNTVITVTGNVGSRWFEKEGDIGRDEVEKNVMEDVKATFRPEFLNRFDAIIIFNSLTPENVRQIVDIQERALNKKLKEQNQPITVVFSPETKDALAKEGYDPKYGVRELKRVIQRRVENILSEKILTEERQGAYTVQVDFKEGAYSLLEV